MPFILNHSVLFACNFGAFSFCHTFYVTNSSLIFFFFAVMYLIFPIPVDTSTTMCFRNCWSWWIRDESLIFAGDWKVLSPGWSGAHDSNWGIRRRILANRENRVVTGLCSSDQVRLNQLFFLTHSWNVLPVHWVNVMKITMTFELAMALCCCGVVTVQERYRMFFNTCKL